MRYITVYQLHELKLPRENAHLARTTQTKQISENKRGPVCTNDDKVY